MPACGIYAAAGFDVFTYEPRNQGESEAQPGFEPLQWITDREVADCQTALEYLKKRPDADSRGIGMYGFSKGANAGLLAAADDPWIRCAVTDGAFGTYSVVVPYMRYWFAIYNSDYALHGLLNGWYYGKIALVSMRNVGRKNGVRYLHVENAVKRLSAAASDDSRRSGHVHQSRHGTRSICLCPYAKRTLGRAGRKT